MKPRARVRQRGHRFVNLVEQRHRRNAAGCARFRFAPLADCADELDILPVERGDTIEWDLFALAVGHRVAVHLIGFLFTDVTVEAAERAFVVERHRHTEEWTLLGLHGDSQVHGDPKFGMVRSLLAPRLEIRLVEDPVPRDRPNGIRGATTGYPPTIAADRAC